MSLYDEIGGGSAIASVVADFWRRVSTDDALWPWFARAESEALRMHLRAYLAVALDGPEEYGGRSMRIAHVGLGVTGEAFDLMVARLGESLLAIGVDPESIARVDARLAKLRPVIVERES
ncbi:MAG: group 1 truncated hemoglobin [Actinomycetota bacterium]